LTDGTRDVDQGCPSGAEAEDLSDGAVRDVKRPASADATRKTGHI